MKPIYLRMLIWECLLSNKQLQSWVLEMNEFGLLMFILVWFLLPEAMCSSWQAPPLDFLISFVEWLCFMPSNVSSSLHKLWQVCPSISLKSMPSHSKCFALPILLFREILVFRLNWFISNILPCCLKSIFHFLSAMDYAVFVGQDLSPCWTDTKMSSHVFTFSLVSCLLAIIDPKSGWQIWKRDMLVRISLANVITLAASVSIHSLHCARPCLETCEKK